MNYCLQWWRRSPAEVGRLITLTIINRFVGPVREIATSQIAVVCGVTRGATRGDRSRTVLLHGVYVTRKKKKKTVSDS